MRGFHIDMNTAQFNKPYLKKWLKQLSAMGYDTIIWEIEANVQWNTCPECAAPEAFTKDEFKEIIKLCRSLKMEPIPLFQTLAHCEYVLKYDRYQNLSEEKGTIKQYCPQNPDVLPFVLKWIDEYIELFGKVKYFHIGADETWWLGKCEKCKAYAEKYSLSDLYIDYVNKVVEPLIKKGITPVIWADMALSHPEALKKLSRKIVMFDWIYSVRRGDGEVHIWGEKSGKFDRNEIPQKAMKLFKKYLYPHGFEYGRVPETFYSADYLADNGFDTVTCPGSSSYGDNVFAPRNWYHMTNTFDSFGKGMAKNLCGSVLTSWTVHLHPWELQLACIAMPSFIYKYPGKPIQEYQDYFVNKYFGIKDTAFWQACGLLSIESLFAYTDSLGFSKDCTKVPESYVKDTITKISVENRVSAELENCVERHGEYKEALKLFTKLEKKVKKGKGLIKLWQLMAANLVNRSEAAILLLKNEENVRNDVPFNEQTAREAQKILSEMQKLRNETEKFYLESINPSRVKEYMHWMYDAVEKALKQK
ncbi:MAG: hypothetical protein A2252_12245 [Elusimicrobia bacterium RIFOXYA2_FULL_39_19]|nr:MAG: hypothetical protein A2252_12245 [Elusimicrobia bacterium RIFOXYA2_FULL_39_19]